MEPYLRLIRGPEGNLPLALGDWVCDLHMAEVLMHLETDVESLEWDSLSDSEPFQPTGSTHYLHWCRADCSGLTKAPIGSRTWGIHPQGISQM